MKRTKHTVTAGILLLLAFLAMPSCLSDRLPDNDCDCLSDKLTVKLSFADRHSGTQTRSIEQEPGDEDGAFNERKIQTLVAFFYQGNTLKWKVNASDLTYDMATNTATLPIPDNKKGLFRGNTSVSYDLFIVANNTADLSSIAEEADNVEALRNLIFQTADFETKGGNEPQSSFVMDGKISKVINLNDPDLGTMNLKRAASKIRLRLVNVDVPGFTQEGPAQARLMHFTDQSALMEGGTLPTLADSDWKTTVARELSADAPAAVGGGKTTPAPFYAYSNDWKEDETKTTYMELRIPLKANGSSVTEQYKYRVPLTPLTLTGDEAQYMNRLDRNFLYDIAVNIKILGSIDEPPVEVPGNYIIKDWSTQEVLVDIKDAHYLVVSERNVTMPNIASHTLRFNSSIADVTLVQGSLKATYTYVSTVTGQPVTEDVAPGQMPTVTVQPNVASGTISIASPIPVNYIPKDIELKVTNGQLTETVVIRQLPATYFTVEKGERSNLREDLEPEHNNPYMYRITTLAPAGDIIWGFPPLDANGNTVNSYEVSQMVSPKFMMASQLGATTIMYYNPAVTNCRNYWEETITNGVTVRYDDWRLPTEAEIKYIDDLQHDSNNPQGIVMRGNYYWDAYRQNGAYRMKDPITHSGSSTRAHVRCIRDITE